MASDSIPLSNSLPHLASSIAKFKFNSSPNAIISTCTCRCAWVVYVESNHSLISLITITYKFKCLTPLSRCLLVLLVRSYKLEGCTVLAIYHRELGIHADFWLSFNTRAIFDIYIQFYWSIQNTRLVGSIFDRVVQFWGWQDTDWIQKIIRLFVYSFSPIIINELLDNQL